ncbi:MAG: hypothetical protein HXX11_07125 [Desulfuromonadales bacterium]|nr:hypothetical protein [Desulfuromonadales bacterium]
MGIRLLQLCNNLIINLFSPLSGFAKDALDQRLSTIRELLDDENSHT